MVLLNDPVGYDPRKSEPELSELAALRRDALFGLAAALALAGVLASLAASLLFVLILTYIRTPPTFGVMWLVLSAVQRGASMMGALRRIIALALTLVTLFAHQVLFASSGVPYPSGLAPWWVHPMSFVAPFFPKGGRTPRGGTWLHPYVTVALNGAPLLLGGGFCADGDDERCGVAGASYGVPASRGFWPLETRCQPVGRPQVVTTSSTIPTPSAQNHHAPPAGWWISTPRR